MYISIYLLKITMANFWVVFFSIEVVNQQPHTCTINTYTCIHAKMDMHSRIPSYFGKSRFPWTSDK
uniref:Uncharacterized protein n=1 Tax=Octopus bimaculoides TaxID=37653 RepID=A0A0L8H5R8_OCTBM